MTVDVEVWFWRIVVALLVLAGLSGLGFVGYAIAMSTRSNGEIDYCFISMWSPSGMAPQWQLHGHRAWREDRLLGTFVSIDEAKAKADVIGCSLTTSGR